MIRKLLTLLVSATLVTACDSAPEPGDTDTDAVISSSSGDGSSSSSSSTGDAATDGPVTGEPTTGGSSSSSSTGEASSTGEPKIECREDFDCQVEVPGMICDLPTLGESWGECVWPECIDDGEPDYTGIICQTVADCLNDEEYECRIVDAPLPGDPPGGYCTKLCPVH